MAFNTTVSQPMILESITTTRNDDGTINIAPMGPHVHELGGMERFELRPFQSSRTFHNLLVRSQGILHVTDDVLLFAQAALDELPANLPVADGQRVDGQYLTEACQVYEFEVIHIDTTRPRAVIQCRTVYGKKLRDFLGFNRARHLILELAIQATRIDFLPREELPRCLAAYAPVIEKTGGTRERAALELLRSFVAKPRSDSRFAGDSARPAQ